MRSEALRVFTLSVIWSSSSVCLTAGSSHGSTRRMPDALGRNAERFYGVRRQLL